MGKHRHIHLNDFLNEASESFVRNERENILIHMIPFIESLIQLQIYEIVLLAETMKTGGMNYLMIGKFIEGLASYSGINVKKRFINKSNNYEKSVFFTLICFVKKEIFINYFDNWMIFNKHRLEPLKKAKNFDLREEILKKIAEIKQSETKNEEIIKKLSDAKSKLQIDQKKIEKNFSLALFDQTKIDDSYVNTGAVNDDKYQTTSTCNEVHDGEINSTSLFDQTKIDDSYVNTGAVNDDKYQTTNTYNGIQDEDLFNGSDTDFQNYDFDINFQSYDSDESFHI